MDASLYPGDVMVATAEKFPTRLLSARSAAAAGHRLDPARVLRAATWSSIAATLAAAYRIGRWAGGPAAAAGSRCLFAFPVRIGLAGEALYRVAFSHSHVASALVIWAIVWFLEGRRLLPLLVLSLGAYNHLLYSAYMLVPLMLVGAVRSAGEGAAAGETLQLLAAAVRAAAADRGLECLARSRR